MCQLSLPSLSSTKLMLNNSAFPETAATQEISTQLLFEYYPHLSQLKNPIKVSMSTNCKKIQLILSLIITRVKFCFIQSLTHMQTPLTTWNTNEHSFFKCPKHYWHLDRTKAGVGGVSWGILGLFFQVTRHNNLVSNLASNQQNLLDLVY